MSDRPKKPMPWETGTEDPFVQEPAQAPSMPEPVEPRPAAPRPAAPKPPQAPRPRTPRPGPVAAPTTSAPAAEVGPAEIGLWGPPASGKTLLLAQLCIQANKRGERWFVYPTPEAEAFVSAMDERIRRDNRLPKPTHHDEHTRIHYDLKDRALGGLYRLTMDDRSGGVYQNLEPETVSQLLAYQGLALLLDPAQRGWAEFADEVLRTLRLLYLARGARGEADPRPIAVCLAKADLFISTAADLQHAQENPDDFVRRQLGDDMLNELPAYCENVRFFPVSSVGLTMRWGSVEPVVFYDETMEMRIGRAGEALNVLEPFLWIIEQLDDRSDA